MTLAALPCALDLGDAGVIDALLSGWASLPGDHGEAMRAMALDRLRRGERDYAVRLARAEAERNPGARSLYLMARLLEDAAPDEALEVWRRAAQAAEREGLDGVARAARLRVAERLLTSPGGASEAVACVESIDLASAAHGERLALARVRLAASSPYARAAALSSLVDLARAPDARVARAAIRIVAEHVDKAGASLSGVEAERALTALAALPDAAERARASDRARAVARIDEAGSVDALEALQRLDSATATLVERARAIAAGDRPGQAAVCAVSLAQDAVCALHEGRDADAVRALEQATLLAGGGDAAPALYTAAELGLGRPTARAAALAAVSALLAAGAPPPLRGYLGLAEALRRAGSPLTILALRHAARLREPGASTRLREGLLVEATALARGGDRRAALERLREAEDLSR